MFIPLRNHTTYSLCKGAIKIPALVEAAKNLKLPALGIMDSQNLFAALEFSSACKKAGIQPIIGCEIFVRFPNNNQNISNLDIEKSLVKMPLIATNDQGYKNLMFLVSDSFLKRQSGISPHVDFELLQQNSAGLIAFSGASEGILAQLLLNDQEKLLQQIITQLRETFPKSFYVEITRHGTEIEKKLEEKFIKIALENNLPLIATNDVYFIESDMHEAQDILSCIGQGQVYAVTNRKQNSPEQYFKSPEEIKKLFADIPEAITNSINIAKRCHIMAFERKPALPNFNTSEGFSEPDALKKESHAGLEIRLLRKFELEATKEEDREAVRKSYFDRIDFELSVIVKMGFPGYFLIVSDFIKWAKENDIPVGPGRGSGAGSVVAWSLEITDLDPLRFGLLFERFLNPDRVSMPDFDIDFCQSRRDEVIDYVQEKYGRRKKSY